MPHASKTPSHGSLHDCLLRWADGHSPSGVGEKTLACALRGASFGYGLGVAANAKAFDLGLRRARRVACPVIGFGNLTTGGTGKTPLVMSAAKHLRDQGRRVAIVSRGYRRSGAAPTVVSDGSGSVSPRELAGDEPVMMARGLPGVAVVVGADRTAAARVAVQTCGADVVLLDDGFQHRALARDCDIVLWDTLRPAEAMALLPRGLMREGLGALRRAHALVFTRANLGEPTRRILGRIKRVAPHLTVFHSSLLPHALHPLHEWNAPGKSPRTAETDTNGATTINLLHGAPLAAFCGLGNPESFWRLIDQTGARTLARHAFPDHCRPTTADLASFLRQAADAGAGRVLITAKDAENLPGNWQPDLPVFVLTARVDFGEDAERFWAFVTQAAEGRA